MKSKNYTSLLCNKLRSSSLFQVYRGAFESVTGYRLDLQEEAAEVISIPVYVGKTESFFLVAKPIHPTANHPEIGILESFAMQLGDEVNRAVLLADATQPQSVKEASEYIREHFMGRIQLDDIATKVGICCFQLCRRFKKHTGITMTEYVGRQRVERARERLKNPSRPIADAAHEAGFTSLSQFNRNFLKYAGESPSDYRARLGQLEYCELIAG